MSSLFEKLKINQKKETQKATEVKGEKAPSVNRSQTENQNQLKKEWLQPEAEGQLAIDVFETDETLVIQSTIAGIKAEDLDISIENDMLTIRGKRERPGNGEKKSYFYQECYWGPFSRQVILPEEVDASQAEAILKDGVLTLKIPKIKRSQKKKIIVKEED